jgi:hypothetical protein
MAYFVSNIIFPIRRGSRSRIFFGLKSRTSITAAGFSLSFLNTYQHLKKEYDSLLNLPLNQKFK